MSQGAKIRILGDWHKSYLGRILASACRLFQTLPSLFSSTISSSGVVGAVGTVRLRIPSISATKPSNVAVAAAFILGSA